MRMLSIITVLFFLAACGAAQTIPQRQPTNQELVAQLQIERGLKKVELDALDFEIDAACIEIFIQAKTDPSTPVPEICKTQPAQE